MCVCVVGGEGGLEASGFIELAIVLVMVWEGRSWKTGISNVDSIEPWGEPVAVVNIPVPLKMP